MTKSSRELCADTDADGRQAGIAYEIPGRKSQAYLQGGIWEGGSEEHFFGLTDCMLTQ